MKNIFWAYVLFAATTVFAQQDLSGLKFCVDPGHGVYPNDKPFETRINMRVANFLKTYLEDYGAQVILTRTDSTANVSLSQREYIANSNNVDFFLSIHHNAYQGNANYTLVLYQELSGGGARWAGQSDEMSHIMAYYINKYIYTTGYYYRGDLSFLGFNLGVLNNLAMPGVLSEGSFWDYIPEIHRLNSEGYLQLEAFSILHSFLEYYEAPKKANAFVEGVVMDTEQENLRDVKVTLTNGQQEMTYITDSEDIGITAQDFAWSGFPYISEIVNGMYFFDNFPSGEAMLIFEKENYISDTLMIVIKDSTSNRQVRQSLQSTLPPFIVSTMPAQGDTNFPAWDYIFFDFNRKMDRASVEANFSIDPPANGSFSWNNDTRLLFRSDTLHFETEYAITISGNAMDQFGYYLDGNGDGTGGDDFVLYFRTGPEDMSPPYLVTFSPERSENIIDLLPVVNITFDEQVDSASVTDTILELKKQSDNSVVAGVLEHYVVNERSTLCFFPTEQLAPSERYFIRVKEGLRDLFGNTSTVERGSNFKTTDAYFGDTVTIDGFETGVTENWWNPNGSGSTTGIIADSTIRSPEPTIVNRLYQSAGSLKLTYQWEPAVSEWLLRMYLAGGSPRSVTFDNESILQVYVFGDGSGNQFRFAVDDKYPSTDATSHEVSPWYTIDWIGWKLISWDMAQDGAGSWLGDGNLDGTLRFDSIQMTHSPEGAIKGAVYFDDLRVVNRKYIGVDIANDQKLPDTFTLHQNYPNPFNPHTNIQYELPGGNHHVMLAIYDVLGKQVRMLVNQTQHGGSYSIQWDGRDDRGATTASGIYLYKLHVGNQSRTKRMLFLQ